MTAAAEFHQAARRHLLRQLDGWLIVGFDIDVPDSDDGEDRSKTITLRLTRTGDTPQGAMWATWDWNDTNGSIEPGRRVAQGCVTDGAQTWCCSTPGCDMSIDLHGSVGCRFGCDPLRQRPAL